jgi:hypothetical protein
VQTSDLPGSQLAGAVTVSLLGARARAGPFELRGGGGAGFGRGALDSFLLEGLPDLGAVQEARLGGPGGQRERLRLGGLPGRFAHRARGRSGFVGRPAAGHACFWGRHWEPDSKVRGRPAAIYYIYKKIAQAEVSAEGEGGWHLAWLRATNEATGASSVLPMGRWVAAPPPPPPPRARSPPPGAGGEPGYRVAFLTARGCFAGTRAQVRRPRPGFVAVLVVAVLVGADGRWAHRLHGPEALRFWPAWMRAARPLRCLRARPRLRVRRSPSRASAGEPEPSPAC